MKYQTSVSKALLISVISCISLSIQLPGYAQDTTEQPAKGYYYTLGSVLSQIRFGDWVAELCANELPSSNERNQQSLKEWKARHAAIIEEIERQPEIIRKAWDNDPIISRNPNRNPNANFKEMEERGQESTMSALIALDKGKIKAICEKYPELLRTPLMDVENSNRKELEIIRKGPPSFTVITPTESKKFRVVNAPIYQVSTAKPDMSKITRDIPDVNYKTCELSPPPSPGTLESKAQVRVKFLIDVNGKIVDKQLITSSGSETFDNLITEDFYRCNFSPALREGVPVQAWIELEHSVY